MQVNGVPGKTLLDCIREGVVEAPRLMRWNAWQTWRSEAGLRPTVRQDGPGNFTTAAQELAFWKAAMAELYGDEWPLLLAQGEEPEDEEDLQDDDAPVLSGQSAAGPLSVSPAPGADGHARVWRSRSPENRQSEKGDEVERNEARASASSALPPASSTSLNPRPRMAGELTRYDPEKEPLEFYQARTRRQSAALAQIGEPLPDGALDVALSLSSYEAELDQVARDDPDKQIRMLKREFALESSAGDPTPRSAAHLGAQIFIV